MRWWDLKQKWYKQNVKLQTTGRVLQHIYSQEGEDEYDDLMFLQQAGRR